ncbi:MAG: AMP-dependent synthetase/ligase [Gemmataceae bacterium]|nr:AMP-dependent synthetase/ligase [Gemmata sp.]MDW8196856.1 AMP-dependent synthetase/ligase [Gemmataceae bacterium]
MNPLFAPRHLADILPHHADRSGAAVAVRYKRDGCYRDLTWAEYHIHTRACAAALVNQGLQPGDRVGLWSENRLEWLLADLGILTAGGVTVSPHASLSAAQVHYQMADAQVRWLFVASAAQLEKVRSLRSELPALAGIVVFDAAAAGRDAIAWTDFLAQGRQLLDALTPELERRRAALGPDDLAALMYTSGTTGEPKGVMLSHGNILSNVLACLHAEPPAADDVKLCWLPLSHIYARTVDHYERLVAGLVLCLAESVDTLVANIAEIQPTHISCVPRFYEKVVALTAHPDPAVRAAQLRGVFGPRIRFLGCGGAPLPAAIEQALRDAHLPIYPGYGLTESSPVITFNLSRRNKPFTVGVALPGVEVQIAPDGEILTRGPHVMKGYWRNPEATAAAIRDGWLHTGDLGSLDADGFLTITGRKKELLVLSNGKKVIPTHIESLLVADPAIDQACVYGEGRHFLTALLVPQWEYVRRALHLTGTAEELARHPDVHALLRQRVDARLADVATYEQVKKFLVLPQPFSVATDELTVSLKMRRNVIFARYQPQLEALYREEPPPAPVVAPG